MSLQFITIVHVFTYIVVLLLLQVFRPIADYTKVSLTFQHSESDANPVGQKHFCEFSIALLKGIGCQCQRSLLVAYSSTYSDQEGLTIINTVKTIQHTANFYI